MRVQVRKKVLINFCLSVTSTKDKESELSLKQRRIEANLEELLTETGFRASIFDSNTISVHEKERILRAYL